MEVIGQLHAFAALVPTKEPSVTTGTTAGLDAVAKKKVLARTRYRTPDVQLLA